MSSSTLHNVLRQHRYRLPPSLTPVCGESAWSLFQVFVPPVERYLPDTSLPVILSSNTNPRFALGVQTYDVVL